MVYSNGAVPISAVGNTELGIRSLASRLVLSTENPLVMLLCVGVNPWLRLNV